MKNRSVLVGSLVAGLFASACCIGPLVLGALGLGTLGLGAALEPYRPWFLGATALLLVIGFYLAYRRRPQAECAPGETCATKPAGRRNQRIILWVVTALAIGVATYPNWGAALSRPRAVNAVAGPASVVILDVTGMSCSACAAPIEKELRAVPGVSGAHVDFEKARATVQLTTSHPDSRILVAAVEKAGYHATPAGAGALSTARSSANKDRGSMVSLKASLDPLVADFNAAGAGTRFVAILSPKCPACVHGAAAIKRALVDRLTSTAPRIFIVWTPMVAGDDEASAREAMNSLRAPGVRHYYDPENRVGKQFRTEVFPGSVSEMSSSVPADHFIAASLRTRDPDMPEWDIYMFFDAGVLWEKSVPRPSRWIRQVARFGEPDKALTSLMWRNSYKSPPIEGDLARELAALATESTPH